MSKMSKAIAALGVVAGLGVAALPLSSYATPGIEAEKNVTAQAVVGDSIAISVDKATVAMNNVMANQEVNEASTNVTVQTNNVDGYKLEIKDADTTTALKTTDGSGTAAGIPAGVPEKGENYWGFKASTSAANVTLASGAGNYRGIKTNPLQIATKSSASAAEGDVITLTFGVTIDTTIAAGTYQDEVMIIVTTN